MAMKRPNGAGQIVKLSGKRRKPYAVRITEGWDPDTGKPIIKYLSYFEKYTGAENYLVMHRLSPDDDIDRTEITLEMLWDDWRAVKYSNISNSTQNNYNAAWNVLGALKKYKVQNIRTAQLQKLIDNATTKATKGAKPRPMSRSSLSKVKVLATMLWDYAMQNDIVEKNYAKFIILPKEIKIEKDAFNDVEVAALEQAAANNVPWADAVVLMIYTGFRISEFLELTPFSYDRGKQTLTGGMKTDAGRNRVVPVHDKIKPILENWLSKGGERIICNDKGGRIRTNYFRDRCYYPALEAAGVRRLTPHATRHTFASLLFAAGANAVQIQKLMGHADYALTANTYTHIDLKGLSDAINTL